MRLPSSCLHMLPGITEAKEMSYLSYGNSVLIGTFYALSKISVYSCAALNLL